MSSRIVAGEDDESEDDEPIIPLPPNIETIPKEVEEEEEEAPMQSHSPVDSHFVIDEGDVPVTEDKAATETEAATEAEDKDDSDVETPEILEKEDEVDTTVNAEADSSSSNNFLSGISSRFSKWAMKNPTSQAPSTQSKPKNKELSPEEAKEVRDAAFKKAKLSAESRLAAQQKAEAKRLAQLARRKEAEDRAAESRRKREEARKIARRIAWGEAQLTPTEKATKSAMEKADKLLNFDCYSATADSLEAEIDVMDRSAIDISVARDELGSAYKTLRSMCT